MPHFESIQIDEPILDKIESKHGVSFAEACEACYSDEAHIQKASTRYSVERKLAAIFSSSCRTTAMGPGSWSPPAK